MLAIVNEGHDIGGNDADAEGGNSDAETAHGSWVTMPKPLTDTTAMACDS